MKRMRYALLLLAISGTGGAQTRVSLRSQSKDVDFSGADSTRPVKLGLMLPAACAVGEMFFKTNENPGSNLYVCAVANQWTNVNSAAALTLANLPAPYDGWARNALLSGSGSGAAPVVTAVTVDDSSNISTPGSLSTGAGSAAAGSVTALRGIGTARLGVQGSTAGEWDITAPANFSSWTFTPPTAPCAAHQWWTTDSSGAGNCSRPAAADLGDASTLAFLGGSQTFTGDKAFTGKVDASAATHASPAPVGPAAARPASCTVGEMYFANDAAAGQNWYYCTAANTWSAQAGQAAFAALAGGANTSAAMVVGSGASLAPAGSGSIQATSLVDSGQNAAVLAAATPSAVDQITMTNGAAGNPGGVSIAATGQDANINLLLRAKGTGRVQLGSGSASIDSAGNLTVASCAGCATVGNAAFSALLGGTNTSASMTVGSGASLASAGAAVINFGAAAHTTPANVGLASARPAACTVGEMYFASDATPGQNWYYCTAANTWTAQVASGGASATDCSSPGVQCIIDTFLPGSAGSLSLGTLGWRVFGASSGYVNGTTGHWGGFGFTTTAASNSSAGIAADGLGAAAAPPLNTETNWTSYFKFKTPASLTDTLIEIGFMGSLTGTGITDGGGNDLALQYLNDNGADCNGSSFTHGADSTWMYAARQAGVGITRTPGPAIAANTWYWLRIRNTGAAGQIAFSIKPEGSSFPADTVVSTTVPTVGVSPTFRLASCNGTAKTLTAGEFRLVLTNLN